MSKELEALKSLKIIKEMYEHFVKTYRELEPKLMICEKEDFDNVETALKEGESVKKIVVDELVDLETTRKKLKALEIIKEKEVNVGLLSRCANAERYNKGICYEPRYLTQEEYDLLKEVLL